MTMIDRQNQPLVGGLYMALAMLVLMSVNVAVKDATAGYPIAQIVFFRFAFSLVPCLLLLKQAGGLVALKTPDLKLHLFSGFIGPLGLYCLFKSFHLLPLAEATALTYASTLFLTILSIPILGEKVGLPRWTAVLVGFGGILVMANPSGDLFQTGIFFSLGFALIDALVFILARILTGRNHPASIVFYFSVFSTLVSVCFLPFDNWKTPESLWHWGQLILLGLGGGVGQILLTQAFRYAPATVAAPISYTSFVWGVLFGMLIWGEFPPFKIWIGCAVLITCGLFITFRAHREEQKSLRRLS